MNIDPLAEKYYEYSAYNYVKNNPIYFVDPDGKEIYINRGSKMTDEEYEEYSNQVLTHLQMLTDNTLAINDKGKVIETGCGGSETCSEGSDVVSDLINSDSKVNIFKAKKNETIFDKKSRLKEDDTPGEGSDLVRINYNSELTEGGLDENDSYERPAFIGLAHELGHARSGVNGLRNISSSGIKDPDEPERAKATTLSNEEVKARRFENKIRKEQGLPLRKIKEKEE